MKKNQRSPRYYNLLKNQGAYTSSDSLVGWWNFTERDVGKTFFADESGQTSGSFSYNFDATANEFTTVVRPTPSSFQAPSFLKGDNFLRNTSVTIKKDGGNSQIDGFDVSNLVSNFSDSITVSMTFRFLQSYDQPIGAASGLDGKVPLLTICDTTRPNGNISLIFDNDGRNSKPSIGIIAINDAQTQEQWNTHTPAEDNPLWQTVDDLRGWQRIDLVITNFARASNSVWPNRPFYSGPALTSTGAALYVNGKAVKFNEDTSSGTFTRTNFTRVVFGGLAGVSVSSCTNKIQLGECAIWNTDLGGNEISELYEKTVSSYGSGVISKPAKVIVHERSCHRDEYPTIKRGTDSRRLGRKTPAFNDTTMQLPPNLAGESINYSTLLLSGSTATGAEGGIVATPNTIPTLHATQTSDGLQGRTNIVNSYPLNVPGLDTSDDYAPFNDSRAPVDLTSRTGYLSEISPDWSSNAGERVIIDIDITPTRTKVLRVVTGSNGQTFGEQLSKPSKHFTGLAYFNFVRGDFETVGGQESETGSRISWCLPGEVSSSAAIEFPFEDGDLTGNPALRQGYDNPNALTLFSRSPYLEDFTKVPRIFQPYSSIIAHRGTFNHVFDTEFDSFSFPAERRTTFRFALTDKSEDASFPSSKILADFVVRGGGENGSGDPVPHFFYDIAGGNPHSTKQYSLGFGGRYTEGITTWSTDVQGVGWQEVFVTAESSDRDNINTLPIWSSASAPASYSKSMRSAFHSTFSTMGRPVAYTNWCRNPVFHASSSQTLRLSNYIDSPMVLESFDIKSSLEATRLQMPMSGTFPNASIGNAGRAATDKEMMWWSNTNNHIDMLTFFLLKQVSPAKSTPTDRQNASSRELISFSNHIFASPWVGWDWTNRVHLFKSPSVPQAGVPGVFTTVNNSGIDFCAPYGGARSARWFEVEESVVRQLVPGVDSFSFYRKPDGGSLGSHGANGVFFNKTGYDPGLDGNARMFQGITNNRYEISVGPTYQPAVQYVTASRNIEVNVPVRVMGAYAQKTTTVLPMMQSTRRKRVTNSGITVPNNGPYFIMAPYEFAGGSRYINPTYGPVGRLGDTQNFIVKPLPALPTMGTFWPGGTTTSREWAGPPTNLAYYSASLLGVGEVFDGWTLPMSSHQWLDSPGYNGATFDETVSGSYKDSIVGEVISKAFQSSVRMIRLHSGSFVDSSGQIGGKHLEPAIAQRASTYDVSASYNRSFQKTPVGPNFAYESAYPPLNPNPGYLKLDWSETDLAQKSGYVLLPDDELIFGMQWSPADAVHRSMKSIENNARNVLYAGTVGTGGPAGNVSGTLPGPREPDLAANRKAVGTPPEFVFDESAVEDALKQPETSPSRTSINDGPLAAWNMAAHYYRNVGYCETNDLAMVASASCKVLNKPMSLRLYGTLIRDQKQQRHSLPQQLTTNCVHEVVGNEPIVDQFRVYTTDEIKDSTTIANQISGSLANNRLYFVESNSKDGWGPVVDRSSLIGRGVRRGFDDGYADVFALRRTARLSDLSEYYYDSLTPDLESAWEADGVTFGGEVKNLRTLSMLSSATVNTEVDLSVGGAVAADWRVLAAANNKIGYDIDSGEGMFQDYRSNLKWSRSFPFEPRYANVNRTFSQDVSPAMYVYTASHLPLLYSASHQNGTPVANVGVGYMRALPMATGTPSDYYTNHTGPVYNKGVNPGSGVPSSQPGWPVMTEKVTTARKTQALARVSTTSTPYFVKVPRTDLETFIVTGVFGEARYGRSVSYVHSNFNVTGSKKSTMDSYFGVGDNRAGTLNTYFVYMESPEGGAYSTLGRGNDNNGFTIGVLTQKPRGYRYGLISSTPKRLTAVYRNDKFGQFRDMLEQRPYSALFIDDPIDIGLTRVEKGKSQRANLRSTPAVTCVFREAAFINPNVMSQAARVNAAETNSCNLSNSMTSSLPFFDSELRNRDSAPTADEDVIVS